MNYGDLQEAVFSWLGYQESGQRKDHLRQRVKDACNKAVRKILYQKPVFYNLRKSTSFSTTSGTTGYYLADDVMMPISLWREGTNAGKLKFVDLDQINYAGFRNTNATTSGDGILTYTVSVKDTSAAKSGTACSVTEGTTTVTGLSGIDSGDVGAIIRLNAEKDEVYRIDSVTSATEVELNRAYRARLTGVGTTGTGSGLSSKKWEVSPPMRWKLDILPTPGSSETIYYDYISSYDGLVNTDESIDVIPVEFEHLVETCAKYNMANFKKMDPQERMLLKAELQEGIRELHKLDIPQLQPNFKAYYKSTLGDHRRTGKSFLPPGTSHRS